MSEQDTNQMKDSRTFEERVFLRFDAMDTRFERIETRLDSIDDRVERLEAKQYDTKPIWEQALAAISGVSARIDETNSRLDARIDQTNTRLDQGFEQLRSEMKAAFANQQQQTEHLVRDVFWQMEALKFEQISNTFTRDCETLKQQ